MLSGQIRDPTTSSKPHLNFVVDNAPIVKQAQATRGAKSTSTLPPPGSQDDLRPGGSVTNPIDVDTQPWSPVPKLGSAYHPSHPSVTSRQAGFASSAGLDFMGQGDPSNLRSQATGQAFHAAYSPGPQAYYPSTQYGESTTDPGLNAFHPSYIARQPHLAGSQYTGASHPYGSGPQMTYPQYSSSQNTGTSHSEPGPQMTYPQYSSSGPSENWRPSAGPHSQSQAARFPYDIPAGMTGTAYGGNQPISREASTSRGADSASHVPVSGASGEGFIYRGLHLPFAPGFGPP
jgi:hypothetical protein